VRPKLQVSVGGQGEPHSVGIEVIGVLMRHKHSVYPGQRVWAGPYTRIDDQRPAVFAQPDARVTELRELRNQKPSERQWRVSERLPLVVTDLEADILEGLAAYCRRINDSGH
jgi:hypothetical protein